MENYSMILIEKRPKYLLYHQVVGNCARFQQKKSRKITRNFTISFHCKRTIATELNLQKTTYKTHKNLVFSAAYCFFFSGILAVVLILHLGASESEELLTAEYNKSQK